MKDKHSKTKYLIKCEHCNYKVREGRQHDLKRHTERVHTKGPFAPKIQGRTYTDMPQHPMIFKEIYRNAITNAEHSTALPTHRYIPSEAPTEPPATITSSLQTFRNTNLSTPIIGPTINVQIQNDQIYLPQYEDISNDGTPIMDERFEMEPTQNIEIIFMDNTENNMPQIEDPMDTLKNDLLLSEDEEDKAETLEKLDTKEIQNIIYTAAQEENEASNTDQLAENNNVEHIHLQQVPDGLRFNILCERYIIKCDVPHVLTHSVQRW